VTEKSPEPPEHREILDLPAEVGLDDTIAAIASAPGGAARGIVRLSGPAVRKCLEALFRPEPYADLATITRPSAVPGSVFLPEMTSALPCELYLWPRASSYTGQPVAEFHTLGSPPLLESLLRAVCAAGARLAQPGEFTLRAFLAGRIDLTQAEAVLGVIDAADASELSVALSQLAGGLAKPLDRLRDSLLDLLAHLEAGFDFADEDLAFISPEELSAQIHHARREVRALLDRMASRSLAAELVRVVLTGRPNTGKSSLFNALARGAGAIVSDQPGTTRDYLTAEIDLAGVKCLLIDTAGVVCQASDSPGAAAIDHAAQAASVDQRGQAHLEILCLDATRPRDAWEEQELSRNARADRIVVFTKTDLVPDGAAPAIQQQSSLPRLAPSWPAISTSSVAGTGLDNLRAALRHAVLAAAGSGGDVVAGTAVRCRESLRLAAECLERAQEIVYTGGGEELVAAEVRVALEQLGRVAGAVYTEDVLDRIFSRFCVGK
jgi:tRNA modification GTPase